MIFIFVAGLIIKTLAFAYFAGLLLTTSAVLLTSAAAFFPVCLFLLISPSRRRWWILATSIVGTLLVYANVIYARFFNDVITLATFQQAGQLGSLLSSIAVLLRPADVFYFLDIAILVLLARRPPAPAHLLERPTGAAGAFIVLVLLYFHTREALLVNEMLLQNIYMNIRVVEKTGLLAFYGFDVQASARRWFGSKPSRAQANELAEYMVRRGEESRGGPWFGAAKGRNVIMVLEEGMQGFLIDLKVEGREITPHFNALARDGFVFRNHYDQTALGRTADAEMAVLASLYPLSSGVAAHAYPTNHYVTLASVLRAQGYHTLLAHAYQAAFWNRRIMSRRFGFEETLFDVDFSTGAVVGWGLSDVDFLEQMAARLQKAPQPFFAYLVTLSNHFPYTMDGAPRRLNLGFLSDTPLGDYFESAHLADEALGRFIAELKANGLYDKSLLVVFGDHDARMPPEQMADFMHRGVNALDDRLIDKAPLVIRVPNTKARGSINVPTGQLDVPPTVLHLLGVQLDKNPFFGRNAFGSAPRTIVFRDGSAVNETHYYFVDEDVERCIELSGRAERPVAECASLKQMAVRELQMSDRLFAGDLQPGR